MKPDLETLTVNVGDPLNAVDLEVVRRRYHRCHRAVLGLEMRGLLRLMRLRVRLEERPEAATLRVALTVDVPDVMAVGRRARFADHGVGVASFYDGALPPLLDQASYRQEVVDARDLQTSLTFLHDFSVLNPDLDGSDADVARVVIVRPLMIFLKHEVYEGLWRDGTHALENPHHPNGTTKVLPE